MDNSKSLTGSILQSNDASFPSMNVGSDSISTSDSSGFFGFLSNINLTTWLIIILILAFLGFNIFIYLAKGTQDISNFFAPLVQTVFGTAATATGQVVDVSAEGAKAVIGGTSNALISGLNAVQSVTPQTAHSSVPTQPIQTTYGGGPNSSLNNALNSSKQQQQSDPNADVAPSSVYGGKAGWCYIGEDNGYRACAKVSADDKCMSGDIFPSQEICMNPNLRV
jgi:hypothetical protein